MLERLTKRNGIWYFVRRVPPEYAQVDRRGIVFVSTGIKVTVDRGGVKASRGAIKLNIDLEASWRAKAGGTAQEAVLAIEDARTRARALELDYKPIEAVAAETAAEIMRRVDALAIGDRRRDPATVAAVLGGVPLPEFKLTSLYSEFEIAKKTTIAKFSPNQFRKWKNGKLRVADLFREILKEDKIINRLTRDDALKFVEHWENRVADGEVTAATANRCITHLTGMLAAVSRRHRLRLEPIFAGARLEGARSKPRPPFSPHFIVNRILAPGALDAMNEEERAIIHILINTGARPSEIVNLRREHIVLAHEIPHIQVRPDDRVLKTEWSLRDIPLVGIALEAMNQFPDGFPRYYDKGDSFSAAVNKFFEDHNLRETPRHTIYSLRHGFKDRLRETEAVDELKDELMGHDPKKPVYGDGHGLRLKLKYVSLVALATGMKFTSPLQIAARQDDAPGYAKSF